jgi:hypothetical protein
MLLKKGKKLSRRDAEFAEKSNKFWIKIEKRFYLTLLSPVLCLCPCYRKSRVREMLFWLPLVRVRIDNRDG